MTIQNYALYPHMRVAQNMGFSLRLSRAAKDQIQSRVSRAADILGLKPLLRRYPRELSGGQRQRVAMGRSIVRDPRVFLFDEPLSNLDAKLRVKMRAEIKELHQRLKTTTIYVTHDQIEAMTMADRIVVMRDGSIDQVGEAAAGKRNSRNGYSKKRVLTETSKLVWGRKYPAIAQSWRRNWEHVIPFFAFPVAVRRIIYTTNAIESLNAKLRRAVRTRGPFSNR